MGLKRRRLKVWVTTTIKEAAFEGFEHTTFFRWREKEEEKGVKGGRLVISRTPTHEKREMSKDH